MKYTPSLRAATMGAALAAGLITGGCRASIDLDIDPGGNPKTGLELQAYPAGVIPAVRWEWEGKRQDVWSARVAYNRTDRRDWGEHSDETGDGFGAGVGWRRWHKDNRTGLHYGMRIDFWDLDIDWKDDGPPPREGKSDILVAQPVLEGGYSWLTRKDHRLDLTLGLGAEINVDTDGEDVGEGAIFLIGLTYMP